MSVAPADLADLIRHVPDFPQPGVGYKDISPLLQSPRVFAAAIEAMVAVSPADIDVVLGMEARGFLFGAPVAMAIGAAFVPVRKPGKLPMPVVSQEYDLEYGSNTLAVHTDAVPTGARALLVDDVLATGGTLLASAELVRTLGGVVVQATVLMELEFLGGRRRLTEAEVPVAALVTYPRP